MVERSQVGGWWPTAYEPLKKIGETVAGWLAPRSDALAAPGSYQINLELPGVAVEDIDIAMRDGVVIVKGEKRSQSDEQGEDYFFSERGVWRFQRTFRLPSDAAADDIVADFRNGVLTINIPKVAEPASETSKIPIRTS